MVTSVINTGLYIGLHTFENGYKEPIVALEIYYDKCPLCPYVVACDLDEWTANINNDYLVLEDYED